MRVRATPGQPAVLGFIVPQLSNTGIAYDFLIRIVGPSLTEFGINDAWARPSVGISRTVTSQQSSFVWNAATSEGAGYLKLFQYVNAFPLLPSSNDVVA